MQISVDNGIRVADHQPHNQIKIDQISPVAQYGKNEFGLSMKFIVAEVTDLRDSAKTTLLRFSDSGYHVEIKYDLLVELSNALNLLPKLSFDMPYTYKTQDNKIIPLDQISQTVEKAVKIDIKGGGMLSKNDASKQIRVWGESTSFGAPKDYDKVIQLLKECFSEYDIQKK